MLGRHEVLPALAGFLEPSREAPWRWIAAACIYAGLRPGDALGLHKSDVDLTAGALAVRHSWDAPLPKDGDARNVVIVPELRVHLEVAMAASRSHHVFTHRDGGPFMPDVRFHLVDHLRRALKRAGIVDGYRHICRRKGCGFEETRPAPSEDRCPKCHMRLWVSPIPRKLRFYDLRRTHAPLLRKAGVDLGAVQRSLGHSPPEITAAVYNHSDLEDYRADVERALTFAPASRVNAPVMQGAGEAKSEAPVALGFPSNDGGFRWSGRLDLNQRPLAPQSRLHGQSLLADLCNSSQVERISEPARSMLLLGFAAFRSKVNAPVMQARTADDSERLLTVKDAAARLRTSTATVYALCRRGALPFARVSAHALRIAELDLAEFLQRGRHVPS